MYYRIEITPLSSEYDSGAKSLLRKIKQFLDVPISDVCTREVYSIFADISEKEIGKIVKEIKNPILYKGNIGQDLSIDFSWLVGVGFKPGVTDNLARTAKIAIQDVVGYSLSDEDHVFSSTEYLFSGKDLRFDDIRKIAKDFLANEFIQTIVLRSKSECQEEGIPINKPLVNSVSTIQVEEIHLDMDEQQLLLLSSNRNLALSLEEMKAIRKYFSEEKRTLSRKEMGLGKNPTDVELEVLAQTWSEHCKHKIFDAVIEYHDENGKKEIIESLYKTYIKRSTYEIGNEIDWLVSVFSDNAGVISFNEEFDLVYKVETHNSPSALDPYGGALTGIVGVNRDPLGTGLGAELLLNVWGYCFASPFTKENDVPQGLFHPNRIRDGVHAGVIEGGNQSGIPYGFGWEYFDHRFLGKPLVFCGTVGKLPKKIKGKPGFKKKIIPGDFIVMGGGRIGKDGIHGATFSSEELKQESTAQVVQIGDPITQKLLSDFIMEARNKGLYRFITDNGAGGLSSSVGEMATECNGCEIDLTQAPLKYHGLQPWEILLSESQERMSFAVPPDCIEEFQQLAKSRDVEVSVLGRFTNTGKFHVIYHGATVAFLDLTFMHHGYPRMHLEGVWTQAHHESPPKISDVGEKFGDLLLSLLRTPNISSIETKGRQYDHEVKGISVIKPFVGIKSDVASDATVHMISPTSKEGIILSCGVAPRYSDIDTYHMTTSVIDLAIRRTIAVGGRLGEIAAIDNFCWPDPVSGQNNPDGPYKLAQLVRSNKALYDCTKAFKVPCISGKDSMKNDSMKGGKKISIPPTLLFSTLGRMKDISLAVTLDAKQAQDLVYVIGETKNELGGSEFYAMQGFIGNNVPKVHCLEAIEIYKKVSQAIGEELCHSVHTPALGGLAIGFSKIAIGGRLGLHLDLDTFVELESLSIEELLFSESNSRFIVTIPETSKSRFEQIFKGVYCTCVGRVTQEDNLKLCYQNRVLFSLPLVELVNAYTQTLSMN